MASSGARGLAQRYSVALDHNLDGVRKGRLSVFGFAAGGMRRTLLMSNSEVKGIRAALAEVEKQSDELKGEGLSQVSFSLGILNLILIVYVFANSPQHFFVLYGLEGLVLVPLWWFTMIRDHNGAFFILDYCWVINIGGFAFMLLSAANLIPASIQLPAFAVFYSAALGPTSWATVALHNGMVFHSVEKISSIFVHYLPCVVCFCIVHYSDRVQESWPGRFPTRAQFEEEVTMWSMYMYGSMHYLVWAAFYDTWLLTIGVDLPEKKGMATVFDNVYKRMSLGPKMTSLTGFTTLRSHAAVYLFFHCIAAHINYIWGTLTLRFASLHILWLVVILVSTVWNGAGYYDFVFAKKYTMVLQELLEEKEPTVKSAKAGAGPLLEMKTIQDDPAS